MAEQKKTFLEKLRYIFAPADAKGVGFFDRLALTALLGAQDAWMARPDDPKEKQVLDAVAGLAPRMGVSRPPKIIIYQSNVPNAASILTGSVVVGTNLMEIMNPGQIEAVLGHELAHHRHRPRDLPALLGTPLAYDVGMEFIRPGLMRGAGPNQRLAFAAVESVGWGAANFLAPLAYMRSLEFEADREGARFTGRTQDMIGALEALDKRINEIHKEKQAQKPMTAAKTPPVWMKYLRTHPPTSERIARLMALDDTSDSRQSPPSEYSR